MRETSPSRPSARTDQRLSLGQLVLPGWPHATRLQSAEAEGTESGADERRNRMTDRLEHPPHLSLPSLREDERHTPLVATQRHPPNPPRTCEAVLQLDAAPEAGDRTACDPTRHPG